MLIRTRTSYYYSHSYTVWLVHLAMWIIVWKYSTLLQFLLYWSHKLTLHAASLWTFPNQMKQNRECYTALYLSHMFFIVSYNVLLAVVIFLFPSIVLSANEIHLLIRFLYDGLFRYWWVFSVTVCTKLPE